MQYIAYNNNIYAVEVIMKNKNFYSKTWNITTKKSGFTLAEVLITLGIIGVVAAMTMPVLVSNYRKNVVETRLKKFYSSMNQAIKMAEAEYGDVNQWDEWKTLYETDDEGNNKVITNTEYFNKYFEPYIAYLKVVHKNGLTIIYFPDGSLTTLRNNGISFYPNAKDYSIKEEESGEIRGDQSHNGTKVFSFFFNPTENTTANKYHYNKGIEPYKYYWDGTEEMLRNNNTIGCKQEVSNSRAYCTALIQMNGWKIPKDYPLRF